MTGRIDKRHSAAEIVLLDPSAVSFQNLSTSPSLEFAPEAYSSCDSRVIRPKLKKSEKPIYPQEAIDRKVQGTIVARGVVEVDGQIRVQVLQALDPTLDLEAVKAIRKYRFEPGSYMGQPVPVVFTISIAFNLRP